jgi:hypothetical protein
MYSQELTDYPLFVSFSFPKTTETEQQKTKKRNSPMEVTTNIRSIRQQWLYRKIHLSQWVRCTYEPNHYCIHSVHASFDDGNQIHLQFTNTTENPNVDEISTVDIDLNDKMNWSGFCYGFPCKRECQDIEYEPKCIYCNEKHAVIDISLKKEFFNETYFPIGNYYKSVNNPNSCSYIVPLCFFFNMLNTQ